MDEITVRELIDILSTRDQDSTIAILVDSLSHGWKLISMEHDMIKRGGENGKGVVFEIVESEVVLSDD